MVPEVTGLGGETDRHRVPTAKGCLALSPRGIGQLGSRAVGRGVRSPKMRNTGRDYEV